MTREAGCVGRRIRRLARAVGQCKAVGAFGVEIGSASASPRGASSTLCSILPMSPVHTVSGREPLVGGASVCGRH